MHKKIAALLNQVSKPGRYTGGELNSVRKDLEEVSLRVALAFPDLYEIGISNLGLQILYHVLNGRDDIAAERVYAPARDMEELLRREGLPLASLESSLPLRDFHIVGFSLQHELAYTNLLNMLDLGGIPRLASERDEQSPLVIAGGPAAFNPEPMADFIDAFFLGDGEEGVLDLADAYLKWKESKGTRSELLAALSDIKGVYVPSFFDFRFSETGEIEEIKTLRESCPKADRRVLVDLEGAPYPARFIVPNIPPIHDRVPLEVARGCSRFCHFCQAGYIYLPVRERSPEKITALGEAALAATGADEVALLSLSTGDYTCLEALLPPLSARYRDERVNLSFPSLRVDTITPGIMEEMKKMRAKSFTIAPEAGSQRLRDLINKGVTEEQILATGREMSSAGCQAVKLYFMIGLPTETQADLDEIMRLSREILKTGRKTGTLKNVTVSLSTFVPKPHTPFQWAGQDSMEETAEKHLYLKRNLKDKGISLKWQDPFMSLLEGIFSRGDRRLGRLVVKAFEKGARFDSWGDEVVPRLWEEAMAEAGIDAPFYLRTRGMDEPLPWDRVDPGVTRAFLLKELERAFGGIPTEDCRFAKCSVCGVCDHKIIKVRTFRGESPPLPPERRRPPSPLKTRLRVRYAKGGEARFLGHIDNMQVLIRLLRRSGFSMIYSEGFHPSPRISFGSPIPLGTATLSEYFDIELEGSVSPARFHEALERTVPPGYEILDVAAVPLQGQSLTDLTVAERYLVIFPPLPPGGISPAEGVAHFEKAERWTVTKKTKRGERELDLKEEVQHLALAGEGGIEMTLAAAGGRKIKAEDAVAALFSLSEEEKKGLDITKRETVFSPQKER